MSASTTKRKDPKTKALTYATLVGAAADAVGAMAGVMLDTEVPDARRWELDAASKALHAAVMAHRGWERIVLAVASDLKLSVDLGPIAATCAACGDQALIIPTASPKSTGLAICRRCSFEDRS